MLDALARLRQLAPPKKLAGWDPALIRYLDQALANLPETEHETCLHDAPPADLPAALRGDLSSASYTLSDMAADAVGLQRPTATWPDDTH